MDFQQFSQFQMILSFLTFFQYGESFLIPFIIYDAAKNGWFEETFVGTTTQTPLTTYPKTTRRTITTTTTKEIYVHPIDFVEYANQNPCGYGPLPSFNPRDTDSSSFTPYVPQKDRYEYTTDDVDNSTQLGAFLLTALQNMKNPNFYSQTGFFISRRPKYLYYKIHRNNFNHHKIPRTAEIKADQIITCTEDSTSLCPLSTMSMCTSNGAIICLANYTSTVDCTSPNTDLRCVPTTLSTLDHKITIEEQMSCISNAKILGNIGFRKVSIGNYIHTEVVSTEKETEERMKWGNRDKELNEAFDRFQNFKWGRLEDRTEDPIKKMIREMNEKIEEVQKFNINDLNPRSSGDFDGPTAHFCVTIVALPGQRKYF